MPIPVQRNPLVRKHCKKRLAFARTSEPGGLMLSAMQTTSQWIDAAIRGGDIPIATQRIAPVNPQAQRGPAMFELLVRPIVQRTAIDPGETIETAEASGRAPALDRAITTYAARYIASLANEDARYAINLSGLSFRQPGQVDRLNRILADYSIDPRRIIWEIGERHPLCPTGATRDNLLAIEASRASVALDDFGVKCSNLALLALVEVQFVKFDRSLTHALLPANTERRHKLMAGLQALAVAAGAEIIFEGIERFDELAVLQSFAPEGAWIQGYAIHRPHLVPSATEILCCATKESGPSGTTATCAMVGGPDLTDMPMCAADGRGKPPSTEIAAGSCSSRKAFPLLADRMSTYTTRT